METFGNKTGLIASDGAIWVPLDAKYPFAADDVGVGRRNAKPPCLFMEKGINFIGHGTAPGWNFDGSSVASGGEKRSDGVARRDGGNAFRAVNVVFSSSAHRMGILNWWGLRCDKWLGSRRRLGTRRDRRGSRVWGSRG